MTPRLKTADVANELDIPVSTLKTWLIENPIGAKTPGGHRRFTKEDVLQIEKEYFRKAEDVCRSESQKGREATSTRSKAQLPEDALGEARRLLQKQLQTKKGGSGKENSKTGPASVTQLHAHSRKR